MVDYFDLGGAQTKMRILVEAPSGNIGVVELRVAGDRIAAHCQWKNGPPTQADQEFLQEAISVAIQTASPGAEVESMTSAGIVQDARVRRALEDEFLRGVPDRKVD